MTAYGGSPISNALHRRIITTADHQTLWVSPLQTADVITELKLGNGTSILIFANIASALPTSVGGAVQQVCALLGDHLALLYA